jgi:hypothetical protein
LGAASNRRGGIFLEDVMASFEISYKWMQSQEDSQNEHAIVEDAAPKNYTGPLPCHAISGINSGAWPADYAAIAALPQDQRGPAVEAFYRARFWNRWYEQLGSDEVAKRVYDMAVNGGTGAAVEILQEASNDLRVYAGSQIAEDGRWGPRTLGAVNSCDQSALVGAFQQARVAYYQSVAAANPDKAKYLAGWTARALR